MGYADWRAPILAVLGVAARIEVENVVGAHRLVRSKHVVVGDGADSVLRPMASASTKSVRMML